MPAFFETSPSVILSDALAVALLLARDRSSARLMFLLAGSRAHSGAAAATFDEEKIMNAATIKLHFTEGPLQGKEYTLQGMAQCAIGRAHDCDIRLPIQ